MSKFNFYSDLDPGIRNTVRWLNEYGFTTTDSGDGISKLNINDGCALDYPHVMIVVDPDELLETTSNLVELFDSLGIDIGPIGNAEGLPCIQATYDPCAGSCQGIIMLMGIDDDLMRRHGIIP